MVDDVGTVINPLIVDGQIHGGLAQGIGQALIESSGLRRGIGQLLSRQLHGLLHAARRRHAATSRCGFNEVPCKTNPLGVKGAGEAGTVGAPPAVINAIVDALGPLGRQDHRHAGDAEAGMGDHSGRPRGLVIGQRH